MKDAICTELPTIAEDAMNEDAPPDEDVLFDAVVPVFGFMPDVSREATSLISCSDIINFRVLCSRF